MSSNFIDSSEIIEKEYLNKKLKEILHIIEKRQLDYAYETSVDHKREKGQYFTGADLSLFMNSMIDLSSYKKASIKILDSGAGLGILSISACLKAFERGIRTIDITLYEIDSGCIPRLVENLNYVKEELNNLGGVITYKVQQLDFILDRPKDSYDLSVINPPYFKYLVKESPYGKATNDLFKGDPNIYASFIAVMLSSLNNNGQAVVISPRSFLNGLYFKGFRKYLLKNSSFEHFHIFKSRNKVFSDSDVLQENIIFRLVKGKEQNDRIQITSSSQVKDVEQPDVSICKKDLIIDNSNSEFLIRIPENKEYLRILKLANKLPSTFSKEGYFISTGPVVEHRTRSYTTHNHSAEETVPVIKAHNLVEMNIKWDGTAKKDLSFELKEGFEKHLLKNNRYVILKRMTSKDEPRRLVAAVYTPPQSKEDSLIGITNKLNYLGIKESNIDQIEAMGLTLLLNSKFMDDYFRCISGSTQVNATDVRVLRVPLRQDIINIGEQFENSDKSESKQENIVYETLSKYFHE